MNLYIACGLTHVPRQIFPDYVQFLHKLARTLRSLPGDPEVKYALVDSDPQLAHKPAENRAALCYDWDRRMVEGADLVVAEVSFPSTGLGIELQIAESAGKPIIMLIGDHGFNRIHSAHYKNPDRSEHDLQVGDGIVSLMAMGLPGIRKIVRYSDFEDGIVGAVEAAKLYA